MTPAERKAAAEVMASNGPWQYRNRNSTLGRNDVWFDLLCDPDWDWFTKEYRVTPKKIVWYVNMYDETQETSGVAHKSRQQADVNADINRIACVRVEFTPGQFDN